MSSEEKPASGKERDALAKALDQMYKNSHPDGPYPPVEIKPKPEQKT